MERSTSVSTKPLFSGSYTLNASATGSKFLTSLSISRWRSSSNDISFLLFIKNRYSFAGMFCGRRARRVITNGRSVARAVARSVARRTL